MPRNKFSLEIFKIARFLRSYLHEIIASVKFSKNGFSFTFVSAKVTTVDVFVFDAYPRYFPIRQVRLGENVIKPWKEIPFCETVTQLFIFEARRCVAGRI
ncbi:unnamed protein product [Hymenolepis diminuta]|uniref:Uncharacterized protein n=1 Tax=Hymenolepis diminuta TaxID=6216 RepID=A0A564YQI4_HYMDI|nr:unnamed protein product [Hymenolepis diminuta]